jgi:primary-amine oxidase
VRHILRLYAGVRSWAERNENVKDTDFVVYIQAGINHVPR